MTLAMRDPRLRYASLGMTKYGPEAFIEVLKAQ
jgi:hypothetical protein